MTHQIGSKPHLGGTWAGGDPNSWAPKTWERILATKKIKSVIDVGCGDGYSLEWFKNHGMLEVGIEGDNNSILRCLRRNVFALEHDYTEGIAELTNKESLRKETLIWCCEFVEHVEEKYISNFLETFEHGQYIAMTHALPGQAGHHHVNCQFPEYWIPKIEALGYKLNKPFSMELRAIAAAENALHVASTLLFFERI